MAKFNHALLALDVRVDAQERLTSIVDIIDPVSAPLIQSGNRIVHLVFWCSGTTDEVVKFKVEIDHPGGLEESPECELPIASNDSATTVSVKLAVPILRPGQYGISLIFGGARVWSLFFTSDSGPESQTIQ